MMCFHFFFCKQKTAYEMRISDWSSDVCFSDLLVHPREPVLAFTALERSTALRERRETVFGFRPFAEEVVGEAQIPERVVDPLGLRIFRERLLERSDRKSVV